MVITLFLILKTGTQNWTPYIVGKVVLYFPPSISEQTAIANILSDCDSEIAALEEKRDKYKEIKQGMMQQLLTGKIRLIGCPVPCSRF